MAVEVPASAQAKYLHAKGFRFICRSSEHCMTSLNHAILVRSEIAGTDLVVGRAMTIMRAINLPAVWVVQGLTFAASNGGEPFGTFCSERALPLPGNPVAQLLLPATRAGEIVSKLVGSEARPFLSPSLRTKVT